MNDDTTDDTTDEGEAIDACGHNSSMKRPHALVDADGTEEKKRRKRTQKLIDLTDVPSQPPIISNEKGASSKYQGVYFNKARNKWKRHYIGLYNQAAVDYARAVFKYKADKVKYEER
eukprot:scaffold5085_cov175-Skeletonema_marinoi.AAC.4